GAIGREDRDTLATLKASFEQRPRDAIRHRIDLRIGELARPWLTAEIDDRDLAEITVANDQIAEIGETRHETRLALGPWRRRGEIGAASARNELAVLVEHLRLCGRELAAYADHLAAGGEITRHRGRMIVDAQIDGRHAAPGLLHHRPVSREINERRQNAAVSITPLRVDHPFLAPGRGELDAIVVQRHHLEPEPLVIRGARDEGLDLISSYFIGHRITLQSSSVTLRCERSEPRRVRPGLGRSSFEGLASLGHLRMTVSTSGCDNHLADHLTVLDQPQPLARLTERQ